ncbi:MAG: deoxyhypusine synthase family protein [archaeon]
MENLNKIKHFEAGNKATVDDLIKGLSGCGFGARSLANSVDILEKMISDEKCKTFFGLSGALVPGGMKKIVFDFLDFGWADVFVTTGANLTHDLIEALGFNHFQGSHLADDNELNKKQIDRIYDVFMPNNVYEKMEEFVADAISGLPEKVSGKELIWAIGSKVKDKNSLMHLIAEKEIPVFVPAYTNSALSLMVWNVIAGGKKLFVDVFADLHEMNNLAWDAKTAGVFYVGGGEPKNFIQQAIQFAPSSAEYGVQITLEPQESGGSSGAKLKEGISWGKLNKNANHESLYCDATIALPVIYSSLKERLKK